MTLSAQSPTRARSTTPRAGLTRARRAGLAVLVLKQTVTNPRRSYPWSSANQLATLVRANRSLRIQDGGTGLSCCSRANRS
jgi:hypothetical protein